jgi:hypothetical protein
MHERDEKYTKIVGEKSEAERPLGQTRCTWEEGIKINLKGIECEDVDWINLVRDAV